MRHQRRLSHSKKGEREQFKHHLLPYPGKATRTTQGKKCESFPEFLFCIPIKPASNILGCELDIFVRLVSVISICIWLGLLAFEGFYLYTEVIGTQTVLFVAIMMILGLFLVLFGIFCGVLGYIGCTISNSRCIYFFFLHLNFQLIVNVYALIASVIRGYIIYSCVYLLSILFICFFLYPSWSLYVHIKINGIPPNVYKHYGLLNDVLSKVEQRNERKSNLEESESLVENVCSSISNGPGITTSIQINSHIFQKKEQNRITMLKKQSSTKTSGNVIHNNNSEDYTDKLSHTAVKFSDENDVSLGTCTKKSTGQVLDIQTLDSSQPSSNMNSLTQPYISDVSYKLRSEAKIFLNWSKPTISVNRNIATSSNTDCSNRNSGTSEYNKLQTSNQNNQPKFTRSDVYNGY
ncbi:uncharacterized protein ELE39_003711 [Cryptosporidium sp. chipmunk genotype I]|uniref:uncharacterized protein n=1 Tax=Cryptosporidium sp. chipmunk genotype I TaxID=1280935 RepID=UPI00351AA99D|nr:hypothetical protein ELE39_003711 [Cryptosporidium sp. chipmunk genotype I]